MEAEYMTDKQFNKILLMFSMILDGCDDLEEAKEKVRELLEENEDLTACLALP